ncbi:MAG: extracellular solute-binding protein [Ruthenibacterium sp.]
MKMEKSLAIVLSAGMALTMFAGCGGSPKTTSTAPAASASKAGTEEQITLSVFDAHAYGLDEYAAMVKEFEAAHPNIKVEVQHAANDNEMLMKTRINSGDIPDVFNAQAGYVAQDYYEYAYDWSNDSDVLSLFDDVAIDTGKNAEGKVMSLPWTYENMGMIYNKDAFEKAGITKLPATMTELEDACKKLKEAGITAFALAAKEQWVLNQISTHYMMDKKLDAAGVEAAVMDGSLKVPDMPNIKNFYKLLDLAVEYGPEKPLEVDWETSENMLANGEAAIIHMGDWCQATLDGFNPDANLGFLPCPVSENPEDATLLSSVSWTYIVNKDSAHLDAAKEYLEFILTSETGIKWARETVGNVSAAKSDIPVKAKLANDAAAYIKEGKTNGWIHTLMPGDMATNIGPVYQSYMLGQTTIEDGMQQAQDFWKA